MKALAPGTILQQMYIKDRVRSINPKPDYFYDVGSGTGDLSSLLLGLGLRGVGFDLNSGACDKNRLLNCAHIAAGRYLVVEGDFLTIEPPGSPNLIVSSMVLEHWTEMQVEAFFEKCKKVLLSQGSICVFVPGSPKHWGIEDEIAGHLRRYTRASVVESARVAKLSVREVTGLTFPLSNLFLAASNLLVERSERYKLTLTAEERTVRSGDREVRFKTTYPSWMALFLNPLTLYAFDILQRWFSSSPNCLVIYFELSPA
jgi:SAM-dependent methyltransferase